MTELLGLTKTIILRLALITLAAGLMPVQLVYADESGKECAESVLDIGMPEIEPEYVIPKEYDKEELFKTTVDSFKSGEALFRIDGFRLDAPASYEPGEESFSSGADLVGLDGEAAEYKPGSLDKGDILKAVPSITTEDDKTLGILVPPFAYFSKKF